ncbi:hypothetical protein ABZ851_32890 [Streptomyces sp. NPDC047049]|uniref:hypothetical protein n=1 Tax=Streptomyces sp. NPDC047049 TaxID=3156688 RepID=UPI0033D0CC97
MFSTAYGFQIGSQRFENVRITWGQHFGKERRWSDGWGLMIEVPVVFELLDGIEDGTITSSAARDVLGQVTRDMTKHCDGQHDNEEAQAVARCFGDCDDCKQTEAEFIRYDTAKRDRAAKARNHENYPYIVTGRLAHAADCHHVADVARYAGVYDRSNEERFRALLKQYTHRDRRFIEMDHEPLDWDGLERWAEGRTGPQGGRYYRACKVCRPQVP